METVSPQITPQRILSTLQAYRDAAALNTAIELELFTSIAHGADTASKLAGELGVPVRGIRLLCEYLAGLGLLEKEDEQLKLPADVGQLLDKQSRAYIGNEAGNIYSPALLRDYSRLTESVRSGVSASTSTSAGAPEWFDLARGVANLATAATAFAESTSFPTGQRLKILDICPGKGAYGIALALRYPDLVVVALDNPESLKGAQINADAARLGTRYQNIPGDPLTATFGLEYDAVLIAGKLHQFDPSQAMSLLMKIHYALKKTGRLTILEPLADDSSIALRLNMFATTSRGDLCSLAEVKGLLESCGYRSIEAKPLPAAVATLITALV